MKNYWQSNRRKTVDPGDWDEVESIGQKILNEMMQYLQNISSKPVWKKPPEKVKQEFDQSLPLGCTFLLKPV